MDVYIFANAGFLHFLFENYVMALEPHTKEYDNELYETMKKRFFAKINE